MILTRKKILIAGFIFIILVSFIFLLTKGNPKNSPTYTIKTVNKDTGQNITTDPNQKPENYNGNNIVTVLGEDKLVSSGMTSSQITLFNKLIANFINNQLGHKYNQTAILNNGYNNSINNITAKMRLGNSDILVNLSITYANLYDIRIMIDYNNNPAYTYDSGTQTAQPPSNVNNPHAIPNTL